MTSHAAVRDQRHIFRLSNLPVPALTPFRTLLHPLYRLVIVFMAILPIERTLQLRDATGKFLLSCYFSDGTWKHIAANHDDAPLHALASSYRRRYPDADVTITWIPRLSCEPLKPLPASADDRLMNHVSHRKKSGWRS